MGATKHEKSFTYFDKTYEQNVIGLKGVFYFGIGLLILIVITFGLMWALLNVLEDNEKATKESDNPMQMSEKEQLPAEPRLQLAPGFGVESKDGRVNLELRAPQAEYWELQKQWKEIWAEGQKDPATGTVVSLPIEASKQKFLAQNVKARSGVDAENTASASRLGVSDSSAGRIASEKRR